jgi:hypothetical protein
LQRAVDYYIAGVYFDPFQALKLADDLETVGLRCHPVQQTHASRGPKDTALYEMVANRELVLYDASDLRRAASGAHAKELGNGLLFLQKAGGRAKIDLLVALSNCAEVARHRPFVTSASASLELPIEAYLSDEANARRRGPLFDRGRSRPRSNRIMPGSHTGYY